MKRFDVVACLFAVGRNETSEPHGDDSLPQWGEAETRQVPITPKFALKEPE